MDSSSSGNSPPRPKAALDAERIIEKLRTNRTFNGDAHIDFSYFPVFADLSLYGVAEETQLELFSDEVRRLVTTANSSTPIQLEGDTDWFGRADVDGYERLDKLAKQLQVAIDICGQDLELQLLEHLPMDSMPAVFRNTRNSLEFAFGAQSLQPPDQTWRGMRLFMSNDKAFHALVNYSTGSIAQALTRAVDGEFWDDNCIIALAKLAAKIKVVALDLVNAAQTCLATGKVWMTQTDDALKNEQKQPTEEELQSPSGKQRLALTRTFPNRGVRYFRVMHTFGVRILLLLGNVTHVLRSDPSLPPDVYEISSVIYDTGFRGRRSLLCQSRSGGIGASGNRDEVCCASFTFDVCLRTFEYMGLRLCSSSGASADGNKDPRASTCVCWKWTEMKSEDDEDGKSGRPFQGEPRVGSLTLFNMRDVIMTLAALSMTRGHFLRYMAQMTYEAISLSSPSDMLSRRAETRFVASFMICTSKHDQFRNMIGRENRDVATVSSSTMSKGRALFHGAISSADSSHSTVGDQHLRDAFVQRNSAINAGLGQVDGWILDRDAIVIQSRWYCWGTLSICAALVLGGLLIGFTVEERIRGVDPFNVSVFCWVLAGFVTLFMKSLRVNSWAWRDFFLGQVVCQSVSEVNAVTGIDEQLFLSILLRLEPVIAMNKKGPFRAVFKNSDPNNEGFSIDVPIKQTSLAEAGLFFVKVQSDKGPSLVGIRTSSLAPYLEIGPYGASEEGREISCTNFQDPGKWGSGNNQANVYDLSSQPLKWSKAIGLFCEDAYFR